MGLLHLSISARDPKMASGVLAGIMGGEAMPFPPFPESWIAFSEADDGSAIEVYPLTHRIHPGDETIACSVGAPDNTKSFVHAAITSPHARRKIMDLAESAGWLTRICNRGPYECVEVWVENRLLVEVLDPDMQADYSKSMSMQNWADMFGL